MTSATTAFLLLAASVAAADRPANHLAGETSPYLLQHAHNPVDWYPWGEEAFAKAKKEDKLVFLSVGYSSCHWCHVMERESFENQEVADLLNRDFVCIKVDREERPDIDDVYITALAAMGRPGGWPMSMFLTADGKPIYRRRPTCRRDDRESDGETIPGFKTVIKAVKKFRDDKPKEFQDQADEVAERTTELLAGEVRGTVLIALDRDLVAGAVDALKDQFDRTYGGFGSAARGSAAPKFPMPPSLLLLQHEAARDRRRQGYPAPTRRDGADHPRPHGPRRRLRPPRRRLPPLQHRTHLDRAALREDALRQRPAAGGLRRAPTSPRNPRPTSAYYGKRWPSRNAT